MQYVVMRHKKDDMDLFAEETDTETGKVETACRTVARKVPELEGFHFHSSSSTDSVSVITVL